MEMLIRSFEGAGPIRFGLTRAEVRELLDSPVRAFKRTKTSVSETDAFTHLGIHVEYDKDDRCVSVEMMRPAVPIFEETDLLSKPYATIKAWIASKDDDIDIDDSGFTAFGLGIGMYADIKKSDKKSTAETVIAFSRTYYDDA